MIVTPLAGRRSAVRDALLSHGWENEVAVLAAGGLDSAAFHVTGISDDVIEAMLPLAARLGLEIVTGSGWMILAGGRARLGAFARPWVQPPEVQALATAVGLAMPPEFARRWRHARGELAIDRAVIVGIVNLTPDSFSDGGELIGLDDVLRRAELLIGGGASVLDVGGESTRPGATPVTAEEEVTRIMPAVDALVREHPGVPISVDTVHAHTASVALRAGAAIINDVTAGRHDPQLVDVVARHAAGIVLSHSRGELSRIASYDRAEYGADISGTVARELAESVRVATSAGIADEAIAVDPGFGFSKTAPQSLQLLDQLDAITVAGFPVMVGVSRKRFLGEATGRDVGDRDRATAAACVVAFERGARLFRVHDPAAVRDALAVAEAVHRGSN